MNIDHFVVMEAVVRLGSFSAAARELNRVQSAISYNVKQLEEDIGVELFSRESYRPSLTPAGEAVYRKARELLHKVQELELLGLSLTQGNEPHIRFDLTPICPIPEITGILAAVAESYPGTRLLISMEIFGGEALVLDDIVDVSLTDVVKLDDRLEAIPWRKINLVPVIAPSHRLAVHGDSLIPRSELMPHVQIVAGSSSPQTRDTTMGVMEGGHTWRVTDFRAKHELIRAGMGWGNLPEYMVAEDLERGVLQIIKPEDMEKQVANLYIVRKRWKAHGPVSRYLWDLFANAKGGSPPEENVESA
jgi:DNA-binding transcriptional LysR family regulator